MLYGSMRTDSPQSYLKKRNKPLSSLYFYFQNLTTLQHTNTMELDERTTYRENSKKKSVYKDLCEELDFNPTDKYREMRDEFLREAQNRDDIPDDLKKRIREVLNDEEE